MPESVRDDHNMRRLGWFFLLHKVAAELRSDPKDGKEVARDANRRYPKRKTEAGDREVGTIQSRQIVEAVAALLPILKVGIGRFHLGELLVRSRLANVDETVRLTERQRPQDSAVEDREYGGRRADADRHGQ